MEGCMLESVPFSYIEKERNAFLSNENASSLTLKEKY